MKKDAIITRIYFLIYVLLGALFCKPPSSLDYTRVSGYKNIVQKYDHEKDVFIIINKSAIPKSILSFGKGNDFYLYVVKDIESKWARIVFNYNGLDQLFFEKISIQKTKTKKLEWIFNNKQSASDNRPGGLVHEEKDLQLTDLQLNTLKTVLVPGAKVRYKFSNGKVIEYQITKNKIENTQKLVEYYESLSQNIIR